MKPPKRHTKVFLSKHAMRRAAERVGVLQVPVDAIVERAWLYYVGRKFEVEFREVIFCCKVAEDGIVILTVKPFKWATKKWKRNWMIFHTTTCERSDQKIVELDARELLGGSRSIAMKATIHERQGSVS